MVQSLTTTHESALEELLTAIMTQFGGAIDFWPLVCLSKGELGDPVPFIDSQWMSLRDRIQELRARLTQHEYEPSEAVLEQLVKLSRMSAELREVFDYFVNAQAVAQRDLEGAVMKLRALWHDVRMRLWLLGALIPLDRLPILTLERELHFESVLDGLFDQFLTARAAPAEAYKTNGRESHAH